MVRYAAVVPSLAITTCITLVLYKVSENWNFVSGRRAARPLERGLETASPNGDIIAEITTSRSEALYYSRSSSFRGAILNPLSPHENKKALILLYTKSSAQHWWIPKDLNAYHGCPYQCIVTAERDNIWNADLVIFLTMYHPIKSKAATMLYNFWGVPAAFPTERPTDQVWMLFSREAQHRALSGQDLQFIRYDFNYTTTFQHDADVVFDYGYTMNLSTPLISQADYAANKTFDILWVVSNCGAKKRLQYSEELQKYLPITIMGKCSKTESNPCDAKCSRQLKAQHRFYLAFENSECREYITEKFWEALAEETVPIVMGPPRSDYEKVAPPHSFIHANDFQSPKHLADYLKTLVGNASLYNQYHAWRNRYRVIPFVRGGTGRINCEICRLATEKPAQIKDITRVWNAREQCV